MRKIATIVMMAAALTACDDGTGLNGGAEVVVAFESRTGVTGGSASLMAFGSGLAASSIEVTGSNGVLSVDMVHVIVEKFQLERLDSPLDCDAIGADDDHCSDFDAPPAFMSLPLGDGPATAVSAQIPPGTYDELEFEINDLGSEEEEFSNQVWAEFANWPDHASMRVAGTFTADGGEPQPFVVYLAASIEVELDFATPFVVTETDVTRTITVELEPRDWFKLGDGTVINLAQHDFETTGSVLEFEVEIANGFKSVEHDD